MKLSVENVTKKVYFVLFKSLEQLLENLINAAEVFKKAFDKNFSLFSIKLWDIRLGKTKYYPVRVRNLRFSQYSSSFDLINKSVVVFYDMDDISFRVDVDGVVIFNDEVTDTTEVISLDYFLENEVKKFLTNRKSFFIILELLEEFRKRIGSIEKDVHGIFSNYLKEENIGKIYTFLSQRLDVSSFFENPKYEQLLLGKTFFRHVRNLTRDSAFFYHFYPDKVIFESFSLNSGDYLPRRVILDKSGQRNWNYFEDFNYWGSEEFYSFPTDSTSVRLIVNLFRAIPHLNYYAFSKNYIYQEDLIQIKEVVFKKLNSLYSLE